MRASGRDARLAEVSGRGCSMPDIGTAGSMSSLSSGAGSSSDILAASAPAEDFAPTDMGIMKGWLTTHTPPAGQRLWFVLSAETLAYYESPEMYDAAEPLGMLGIDEMQSVKGARSSTKRATLLFFFLPHRNFKPLVSLSHHSEQTLGQGVPHDDCAER